MLASYLKLALKVLARRKFFTFVSLFGVGLTMLVLVVAVALLDHNFAPLPPEVNQDRTVGMYSVALSGKGGSASGNVGWRLFDRYARNLPGVERVSIFANTGGFSDRLRRQTYAVRGTDGQYWKILQFQFLEGGPFSDDDVRDARLVAVISESTRDRYFGGGPALGKTIQLDRTAFTVVGVVPDVSAMRTIAHADVWAPFTAVDHEPYKPELLGSYSLLFLATSAAAIPAIKEELRARLRAFESPDPRRWSRVSAPLDNRFERAARAFFQSRVDTEEAPTGRLWAALGLLAAFFIFLPTVNLVNLNVSRILERAPEIGVRKAFGASVSTLVGQFLLENLLLTLLGAVLGIAASTFVLGAIGSSGLLPHAQLRLNWRVTGYGVVLAVVFGLVSGVYPAWRMARLRPVRALAGGER